MVSHYRHVERRSKGSLKTPRTKSGLVLQPPPEEQFSAEHSGLGGLVLRRIPFDQLVSVALFFLFGGLAAKLGQALE